MSPGMDARQRVPQALQRYRGTTTSQKKEGEILQYEWEIHPSEERGKPSITRGSSTTLTCGN